MGSAVRAQGKEHIPNYPGGWITIRILQLIVAIVILGLCCYLVTTSILGAGFYVMIFTVRKGSLPLNNSLQEQTTRNGIRKRSASKLTLCEKSVCTIITSIWLISAHSCAPRAFNYWAVLVLDIYQYLLWLGGFAASAILAAGMFGNHSSSSIYSRGDAGVVALARRYTYDWYDDYYSGGRGYSTANSAIGAAAAGLGALQL